MIGSVATDLAVLREEILRMAALVERAIRDAVRALVERDSALASQIIEDDRKVNELDVRIDEHCIRVLALRHPVASDLRLITTAMKITTDLERIGDYAVNISKRALELNEEPMLKPYVDIPHMGRIAQGMVRDSIDAFVTEDKKLAMDILMRDDEVDDLNEAIVQELIGIMGKNPESVNRALKITYISRYLERIGDHATNIAELVIYLIEGRIVRHMPLPPRGGN